MPARLRVCKRTVSTRDFNPAHVTAATATRLWSRAEVFVQRRLAGQVGLSMGDYSLICCFGTCTYLHLCMVSHSSCWMRETGLHAIGMALLCIGQSGTSNSWRLWKHQATSDSLCVMICAAKSHPCCSKFRLTQQQWGSPDRMLACVNCVSPNILT